MLDKVKSDLKEAMLAREELRVGVLRMLNAELMNAKIAKGSELSDVESIVVVQREIKKRKEATEAYRMGGREESAQKEEQEAKILERYLPAQLSDEELSSIIDEAISSTGAQTMADMGKVMGQVRAKVGQSATGDRISSLVKSRLSQT